MKKTQPFTLAGLSCVLELQSKTPEELRDQALVSFICFTSMRIEDVDFAKTKELQIKAADNDNCRRIVAELARTKNDKSGKGPVSGRTFVLPCICMEDLPAPEKKSSLRRLQIIRSLSALRAAHSVLSRDTWMRVH